jgi:UDP-glucose 4-epimerase
MFNSENGVFMSKRLKIAVLGAGFIGSNLIDRLIIDGHAVNVLDRNSCPSNLIGKVNWFQSDISENFDLSQILENVDIVFHLFSNTVPGDEVDIQSEIFYNVGILINILDTCIKSGIRKLFFLSSASVYGQRVNLPLTENDFTFPISMHAVHKITLENILGVYNVKFNMDCKVIRLSNPYGIGQRLNGHQGIVSILIGNYLRNEVTTIMGDGSSIRDYIHINDVINALKILMNSNTSYSIFNLGSGTGVSINHIINLISKSVGADLKIRHIPRRTDDIDNNILDISLITDEVGFMAKVDLEFGIKEYTKYCLDVD